MNREFAIKVATAISVVALWSGVAIWVHSAQADPDDNQQEYTTHETTLKDYPACMTHDTATFYKAQNLIDRDLKDALPSIGCVYVNYTVDIVPTSNYINSPYIDVVLNKKLAMYMLTADYNEWAGPLLKHY